MEASKSEASRDQVPVKLNIAVQFVDAPAALHPGRTAIAGEPRAVSYGELAALTNRAGNALRAQGVSRGDRVLIALPDSAEFVAAFFGAAKIGAVAVPVNPFARSSDYIHYLENCAPHVAIVHTDEALGVYGAIDCGGYLTSFMLAAQALGVATIPQAALAFHAEVVRQHFGLGDDRRVVCGISFGYPDREHKANSYRTTRAGLADTVRFVGD